MLNFGFKAKKFLIKITHMNYFKAHLDASRSSSLESSRFLFITKITNSKLTNDLIVARFFEQVLEIPVETLNRYHSNQISIEEVLNIDKFFFELDNYLPLAVLILEIANKESPFESFFNYGNPILMTTFSKMEFSLHFPPILPSIKFGLVFRNMVFPEKKKIAISGNFSDNKNSFDFSKIVTQSPKLNSQNLEFGDNLIIFQYDSFERLQENLIFVLKYIKIKVFFINIKTRIEIMKKEEFKVSDDFDGKKMKIKVDKIEIVITFSEKPELASFIGK